MERIGRGTQNIVKRCTEVGMPAPVWKVDETGVTLTFSARQKVNARQAKVIKDLAPHKEIRHSEYCKRYLVSDRQGRRDLEELGAWGFFNRVGGGPKTTFVRTAKPARTGQGRADDACNYFPVPSRSPSPLDPPHLRAPPPMLRYSLRCSDVSPCNSFLLFPSRASLSCPTPSLTVADKMELPHTSGMIYSNTGIGRSL